MDLISSWNKHSWWDLPQRVGSKIARLIGAETDEVVVADSTSINVFKVVAAALDLHPGKVILSGKLTIYIPSPLRYHLNLTFCRRSYVQQQAESIPWLQCAVRANFPTDLYMLEGLIRQLDRGLELRLVDSDLDPLVNAIDADVAVVVLTHVSYRSGHMLNMAEITAHAHHM